jgi:hypothetical protein
MLLEIKSSIGTVDTRWAFFQAPFVVEDALGFKFLVPSEYNFELLDKVIQWRFRDRDCFQDVQAGNYELFNSRNSDVIITSQTHLAPGTSITMAMIIASSVDDDEKCPMPNCDSNKSTPVCSGGRQW